MSSLESFQNFVKYITDEYLSIPAEERYQPFRLAENLIAADELTGHCSEWAAQYLYCHKCPIHWANAICAEVVNRIRKWDYLTFAKPTETETVDDSQDDDHVTLLEASKLCQQTFETVNEILEEWSGSPPSDLEKLCTHHPHIISYHAIKNSRRKMEDRHVIVPLVRLFTENKSFENSSLYAVFDGHGGVDASYYSAAHFLSKLTRQTCQDKGKAIIEAFKATDSSFTAKAARERLNSGSTAVAVVVEPSAFYVGWLGDSQATLVKNGRAIEIMDPHKPDREDEKERIESLGGCVLWYGTWRVNGTLAVSRAIGDVDHKPYVCCDGDTNTYELDGGEEYLVIACDGLWDTVTPDKLVDLVYDHVSKGGNHKDVAEMLVKEARREGSSDNITVIVIFFNKELSSPAAVENDEEVKGLDISKEDTEISGDVSSNVDKEAELISKDSGEK